MAERMQIYKCMVCGNIVEVLHAGAGELVCCGKPMEKLAAKTAEQGKEKHLPVIERTESGIEVKVGSVAHPMEEKHYIEWIEVSSDGKSSRQFLKPGDEPQASFAIQAGEVAAQEHCNVHGLWRSEQ